MGSAGGMSQPFIVSFLVERNQALYPQMDHVKGARNTNIGGDFFVIRQLFLYFL